MTKVCKKCGVEKDLTEFYRRSSTKYKPRTPQTGYRETCKACDKVIAHERYMKRTEGSGVKRWSTSRAERWGTGGTMTAFRKPGVEHDDPYDLPMLEPEPEPEPSGVKPYYPLLERGSRPHTSRGWRALYAS
jgi:hypothetical protein